MKVLVCPNTLVVGGASLIAVELAAAVRSRGHEVLVLAAPGPLSTRLEELGLPWIEAPATDDGTSAHGPRPRPTWPSPRVVRQIRQVVRAEGVDVVHTYEWLRCLEAAYGAGLVDGVPLVSTILHVDTPRFLPRSAHFVVGASAQQRQLRARGLDARLIEPTLEPPVGDVDAAAAAFRTEHGLDVETPVAVIASRLAGVKVEGIGAAIDAVGLLGADRPVQLVVAGDGPAAGALRDRGRQVDERLGRRAVVFTGNLDDVVPAYAAADVVLGMGSSLAEGMALGKPAIVLGTHGFAEPVTESTGAALAAVGFWGTGDGADAAPRLAGHLAGVLEDPRRAASLGALARGLVAARPDREQAAAMVEDVYRSAVARPCGTGDRAWLTGRSFTRFTAMRARWWVHRTVPGRDR